MQGHTTINNQNSQAINDIRGTLTKLTTTWSSQEKNKFPSQPQPNPQHKVQQFQTVAEASNVKNVEAITTLRSGKVVDILAHGSDKAGKVPKPTPNEDSQHFAETENSAKNIPYVVPAPFPQRLASLHKEKHHAEILEIFK